VYVWAAAVTVAGRVNACVPVYVPVAIFQSELAPSGHAPWFAVTTIVHQTFDQEENVFDRVIKFVEAHSIFTPFIVDGDIEAPARVVLKYFTQSTIAPWNGEESTFVLT
jgi:hypothetical protein